MAAPEGSRVRFRDLAVGERPQERLQSKGAAALSDTELLAMLLRKGSKEQDVMELSTQLMAEAGSLAGLLTWSESDFMRLRGIGRVKALQLITVMEVARRILSGPEDSDPVFSEAESVHEYMAPHSVGLEVEKFWVLCLNRKNRLIRRVEVSSGTVSGSLVHPREVFREAIRLGASGVICLHNHPSGDPSPSQSDIAVTRQLRDAAKAVEIDLVDHIVIGLKQSDPANRGYYSFVEAGLL